MSLSDPFIRRPIATSLLAAAVLLAGAAAFFQLPVAPLPRVDVPTISVNANLPGASPETMATAVATPLERRFGRIAGLAEMTSTSSLGSTSITLQFDLDREQTSAARDVQAAINAAAGDLPPGMPTRPNYRKVNPADTPILILSLTSPTLPLAQVFEAANSVLAQKISQVEGVGQVFVGGGQQPAVRVQVDPAALAGVGLGLDDVRTAIAQATANQPKGAIIGPVRAEMIAANDQLFGAAAYEEIVVSHRAGAAVRLGDVAKVRDDVENNRVAAWNNATPSVLLFVRRQPDANILATIDRIKALLPSLTESISPSIEVGIASDRAQSIRASVHEVEQTLLISVVLVVLVVFAFLRNLRATSIPSVAVPLSLVGTFAGMYLFDYNLDNLSLMALTIATGFVVDDAIVVTENVSRFLETGMPPAEAARRGARQIGFTIVSITVSLLAVLIPLLFMGGVVGRLFREFAVTLAIAIAFSAVVSLTVTPAMCATVLRSEPPKRGRWARMLDGMTDLYERALVWTLRHPLPTLVVWAVTVGLTVYLFWLTPKGLFPQQDNGVLMGATEGPPDISFPATRERQTRMNEVLTKDPDVENVVSFLGSGPGGGAGNTGAFFVSLKPKPGRKASAEEIIARLRPQLARVTGLSGFLQAAQDLRIGGRSARTQYQYTLQDADLAELRSWVPKVVDRLKELPELRDVNVDRQAEGLELSISLDRDSASRLGITAQAVDEALYDAFGQRQIATSFKATNYYRVVLEADPALVRGPDAVEGIFVRSVEGHLVPLPAIARFQTGRTALSVNHQGQFPANTISFNLSPGVALGDAVTAIQRATQEMGLPASVSAGFQGTAQAFRDSLATQPLLITAALVIVYIVLGVLYESLLHPITILSTLPPAGVGALVTLLLFGQELNVMGLIGLVLLIGIVKKNAIMMIDFAIETEREEGLSPAQAIHKAARLRFRPITMTTLAALLGALPLALGGGTGAELRRPLGLTIVGGLVGSQLLTLLTTPVIYLELERLRRWVRRWAAPRPAPAAAE